MCRSVEHLLEQSQVGDRRLAETGPCSGVAERFGLHEVPDAGAALVLRAEPGAQCSESHRAPPRCEMSATAHIFDGATLMAHRHERDGDW